MSKSLQPSPPKGNRENILFCTKKREEMAHRQDEGRGRQALTDDVKKATMMGWCPAELKRHFVLFFQAPRAHIRKSSRPPGTLWNECGIRRIQRISAKCRSPRRAITTANGEKPMPPATPRDTCKGKNEGDGKGGKCVERSWK